MREELEEKTVRKANKERILKMRSYQVIRKTVLTLAGIVYIVEAEAALPQAEERM